MERDGQCPGGSFAEQCKICGAFPASPHFGGMSCEGCRAFFKRVVDKGEQLRCFFGGECDLAPQPSSGSSNGTTGSHSADQPNRSKFSRCRACRYRRCLENGLKPDGAVFPSVDAVSKRSPNSTHSNRTSTMDDRSSRDDDSSQETPAASRNMGEMLMEVAAEEIDAVLNRLNGGEDSKRAWLFASHIPDVVMDQGSLIGKARISDSRPGHENDLPPFLRQYRTLLQEKDALLSDLSKTIDHAAYCAFHEQIQSYSQYMRDCLQKGAPAQPQQSVELTIGYFALVLSDMDTNLRKFVSILPGYSTFTALRKKHMFHERFPLYFVVHHASFVRDNEIYIHFGPNKAHYCQYWRTQLINKDYDRLAWPQFAKLNSLQLTMGEKYTLLAAACFRPSSGMSETDEDYATMKSFHECYLSVLEYQIRSRSTEADMVLMRLHRFLAHVDTLDRLNNRYMPPQKEVESAESPYPIFSALMSHDEGLYVEPS